MISKIEQFIKDHSIVIIISINILLFTGLFLFVNSKLDKLKETKNEVTIMTPKQLQDENYIRNTLDTTKDESKVIVVEVGKAQTNQLPPTATVTINSTSPQEATKEITERIEKKDPTLPKEAIEKTDKTIVSEQPKNEEYKVGVYKINTYKNWGIGLGLGKLGDKKYIPLVIGRQYAHNKSLEFQINYSIDDRKIDGGQIVHKWHF